MKGFMEITLELDLLPTRFLGKDIFGRRCIKMPRRKPGVAKTTRALLISPYSHHKSLLVWSHRGRLLNGNRLDQTSSKKTRSSYTCCGGRIIEKKTTDFVWRT